MMKRKRDLVSAGIRAAASVLRQLDASLSAGSLENAREAVRRSEMREALRTALDGSLAGQESTRRSA